ncbi:MAG: histidinol-phosphate transaminase [Candidatus Dadabacteria bacterium]|nr:MAG: histidinol-phosphate transaminase [Candidatus Dadabacteria bacterium]
MTFDATRLVHSGIAELHPYEPGKPVEDLQRELGLERIVKLASNENPFGPSPAAITRMQQMASEMHRYPDGAARELREALSTKIAVPVEQIITGNGSNELLELALRTFVRPGETVVSAAITFAVYGLLSQALGARYITAPMDGLAYDLDALADLAEAHDARLIFVANPNNPTGTACSRAQMRSFLGRISPNRIVVYDAAYAEYADPDQVSDGLDLLSEFPNVFVTRTFSKAYGLAGLRIGWGVGHPSAIDMMQRVRQPFNVNRMGQGAAVAALDDTEFLDRVVEQNRRSIEWLTAELGQIGLRVHPSQANFVLFDVPRPADELFEALLHEGVIVRSMRGFGLPHHLRVNTGTDDENAFFVAALRRVLGR